MSVDYASIRHPDGTAAPAVAQPDGHDTLAVLGLVFVGLTGGTSAVSVPAGAHAGQLKLTACTYPTEKGNSRADCGTLVVPENRTNPHSRLIALPVIVSTAIRWKR